VPSNPAGRPQQLPAGTRLGVVHVSVTDLERALAFWTPVLGLSVIERTGEQIELGAGGVPLVRLHGGAESRVMRHRTGLYHLAIHFRERAEFARSVARLFARRYPNSPTDHLVTETTYVWDPDGNGIELTFETPERGQLVLVDGHYAGRTPEGRLTSGRDPLDLDSVFAELRGTDDLEPPIRGGVRIGHVHLHVRDLDETARFYTDAIGFAPLLHMPAIGMSDVNVDGHVPHTMAFNIWAGAGAAPREPSAAGLRHATIVVPDEAGIAGLADRLTGARWPFERTDRGLRLTDPSGNGLHVERER
jgi:catechol 2,3-dioxygenase